ncbi:hypothetical protein M3J09_004668 [Ascochyta lentis]
MSGLEVAGLAVGVLPILVEAIKSYSTISQGFRTFRHYSKEVKTFSIQLKVQKGVFRNEMRLLLRLIEDARIVEEMLEDAGDSRWTNEKLNGRLIGILQHDYESYQDTIEETAEILEGLELEIEKYNVLLANKAQTDTIRSTIKHLRGAVKIAFDKSKHESWLAKLREKNADLSMLRNQHDAFRNQTTSLSETVVRYAALPTRFSNIQEASQKLHEALCQSWCCDDAAHRGHYAKLCVAAEADAEVQLDLAISCQEPSDSNGSRLPLEPPLWLYVQSMSMSAKSSAHRMETAALLNLQSSIPTELKMECATFASKKKALPDPSQQPHCRKRAKRVHFADSTIVPLTDPVMTVEASSIAPFEVNLCQQKDICHYLRQTTKSSNAARATHCLGYLETPQTYKHRFYLRQTQAANTAPTDSTVTTVYSLFDMMRKDADDIVTIDDQFKLAHKTALAMLQYNKTPWLNERWRLRDINYFGSKDSFDENTLKSLHLSSQISAPHKPTPTAANMEGIQGPAQTVSEEMQYGINNVTLFFLGVALLEIAHWKPIEVQMQPSDHNNQIFAARRIASSRPSSLGPVYQKIAEKCLQCNFGFGTKLESKRLQTAVYNDVICGLENLLIES